MSRELQIDEEFKNLIPPLSEDEFSRLEKQILNEGVREPIVTWNGVIVDGHNRYKICQKHGLPFEIEEKSFGSREAAKIWSIENQVGRRNLDSVARMRLVYKLEPLYAAEAKRRQLAGLKQYNTVPPEPAEREDTRDKLSKLAGVGHTKYSQFRAIEREADKGNEKAIEAREKIASGEDTVDAAYHKMMGKTKERKKEAMEKYKDADRDLRENVAVFNRASLIAELNGSAQMLDESWHQSIEINETQGVKLTKSEVNSLFNAIDHLYNAIKDIQKEG